MATTKSYIDLSQSKKLAKILPLESADMFCADVFDKEKESHSYNFHILSTWGCNTFEELKDRENKFVHFIPCWSLAALLSVTRNYCTRFELTLRSNKKYNLFAMTDNYVYHSFNEYPDGIDEPIDVCVALIEKLHELKML